MATDGNTLENGRRIKSACYSAPELKQKTIPNPGFGQQMAWSGRVGFQLLMKNVQPPTMLDINFVLDDVSKIHMVVSAESRYEVLPRSRLEKSVHENILWKKRSRVQSVNSLVE
ncbi:hypothetical protein HZV92_001797 [Salmonella enterica]|nr:hypothetical protein [Salmonella enterica]EFQ6618136.1 hypothetical protein [Salmonella enterica]